jgi:AcrR family transcriptional regulator
MTRHRRPEEWEAEILEAAASEIEQKGYAGLTMEAIADRIELSKGGVYRFYRNRRDVALALFAHYYGRLLDFDIDEALSWDVTLTETISRIFHKQIEDPHFARYRRIWMQLVPETLRDDGFSYERAKLLARFRDKYRTLVQRILAREGTAVGIEVAGRLESALFLGTWLMEGLSLQDPSAAHVEEEDEVIRRFIDALLADALKAGDPR